MKIRLPLKRFMIILGDITGFLIVSDLVGLISKYIFGFSRISLFQLDREANIPTLYSSVGLLLCAALLALIAFARKLGRQRDVLYWTGLAFIFLFLGIDESAGVHERLIVPLRSALHASGPLYFAWIIPYGIFTIDLGVVYFHFLLRLPTRTRFWVFLAGAFYIAGALGGEMLSGMWASAHGQDNIIYALLTSSEETLELLGILTFIYFLLLYMTTEIRTLNVEFDS